MRYGVALFLITLFLLSGCATVQENAKGIAGVSTKQIEEAREGAVIKTFPYDYRTCSDKVERVLKHINAYVYARDNRKKMIATYISWEDTTPVGIFFKEIDATHTQVEVSSPSTYGKNFIAKKVFAGIEGISAITEPTDEAQPGAVLVTVGNLQAMPGDEVVIPVSVTDLGSLGITSAYLIIGYDSTVLTLVTVKNGALTKDWNEPVYSVNPAGVDINLSGKATVSGSGILVKLIFQISPFAKPGTYGLDLNQATFNEGSILNKMIGGVLTLVEPTNPESKKGKPNEEK